MALRAGVCLLLTAGAWPPAAAAEPGGAGGTALTVFVPCGMISPFFGVKQAYEATHPGVTVELVFDRADLLTERILKGGAVPDVHLSIGHTETELLVKAGHVEASRPVPFGTFRLALATHVSKKALVTRIEDLAKPEVRVVVCTPPENSSVGVYTRTLLTKLNLWAAVAPKIVYLPTIKDCHKQLSAGKADAEFAYIGCPIPADPAKAEYSKVVAVQVVDEALYGGAVAFASVLKAAPHPAAAAEFVAFLGTPEVRLLLAKVGLGPVSGT